jgi:WD40 repeat protein
VAQIPSFTLSQDLLGVFPGGLITSLLSQNALYMIRKDYAIYSIQFPKVSKGSIQATLVGSVLDYVTVMGTIPPRAFLHFPQVGKFVTGTPPDCCFHVFKIDISSLSHSDSFRQPFSLLSTLNYGGGSLLLMSWRDSSLVLWDLSKQDPLVYRTTPHLKAIVDVESNPNLKLIASLDTSRQCVLSYLHSGKFLRSFVVDGTDTLQKLALFSHGFVTILSEPELTDGKKSVIRLYGIDTRKLGDDMSFHGEVLEWAKLEYDCGLHVLAIAFRNRRFMLLRIPDLEVLHDTVTDSLIIGISLLRQENSIVLTTADGEIWILRQLS